MGLTITTLGDRAMADEPVLQFYDEHGRRVEEGSPKAVVQYLSDDPARPDAKATLPAEDKAAKAPPATTAAKPAEDK